MIEERKEEKVDFTKHFQPIGNYILVRLIKEADEYFPGLKKLDTSTEAEPYVEVLAVGAINEGIKVGDLAFCPGISFTTFRMFDYDVSLIRTHNVQSIISRDVALQIKRESLKNSGKADDLLL